MGKSGTEAVSFRIPQDKADKLKGLAKATERSKSWHLEQALDSYMETQAWQVEQIEQAMDEMDGGQGISHQEVKKDLAGWGSGDKNRPGE